MAGIFVIQGASSVTANSDQGTGWGGGAIGYSSARPTDDSSLLAGINSNTQNNPSLYAGWVSGDGSPAGNWLTRFGFQLSDSIISLDGNSAISYSSLPAGILILTAALNIETYRYPNVVGDTAGHLFFQQGPLTESSDLAQRDSTVPIIKTFNYIFTPTGTFLDVLNAGFGIRVVFASGGSVGQGFYKAQITGTYEIRNKVTSVSFGNGRNIQFDGKAAEYGPPHWTDRG